MLLGLIHSCDEIGRRVGLKIPSILGIGSSPIMSILLVFNL